MLEEQKERLLKRAHDYLSIGITEDGKPRDSISIPWEKTAHAYYMRIPNVYITPEDLKDEEIMKIIGTCKVQGCYIWTVLDDYSFISNFREIEDIYIRKGEGIRNLDFLKDLDNCRVIFLQNAKLKNLNAIINLKKQNRSFLGLSCVGLYNCEIEDLSAFEKVDIHFAEFLIWNPKSRNERDRWSAVSASTKRYYEIEN